MKALAELWQRLTGPKAQPEYLEATLGSRARLVGLYILFFLLWLAMSVLWPLVFQFDSLLDSDAELCAALPRLRLAVLIISVILVVGAMTSLIRAILVFRAKQLPLPSDPRWFRAPIRRGWEVDFHIVALVIMCGFWLFLLFAMWDFFRLAGLLFSPAPCGSDAFFMWFG